MKISQYMDAMNDSDYNVWIVRKRSKSPISNKRQKLSEETLGQIGLTFREIKLQNPSEHAAAISLVYAAKMQKADRRLEYNKQNFLALGAFAQIKEAPKPETKRKVMLAAALFVKKSTSGNEYRLIDIYTSFNYTIILSELEKRLLVSHLLPWLQSKSLTQRHPTLLPSITVTIIFSSGRCLTMLPHLMGLGFHVRTFFVNSYTELSIQQAAEEDNL